MIGNDVVDLGDPETFPGSCHARFDARVFAASELEALASSPQPERLRWILWAAKEAAYKLAKKHDRRAVFSPRRFLACLTARDRAEVAFGAQRYAVALELGERHLHAIATDPRAESSALVAGVERLAHDGDSPGDAVRAFAIAELAPRLGLAAAELRVTRAGRIPRLERRDGAIVGDLSLSHHGRFVAFACALAATADETRGAA